MQAGQYSKDALACLNCGNSIGDRKWPYLFCSDLCQQEGEYVRYKRRKVRDGTVDRPDIQEELMIQSSMILGGGYPTSERRLNKAQREVIFTRDNGRCRKCGLPGNEIDHIGVGPDGDVNHPDNLQLLCTSCHREKTLSSFRSVTPQSDIEEYTRINMKWSELEMRVACEPPSRISDDQVNWPNEWLPIARLRSESKKRNL